MMDRQTDDGQTEDTHFKIPILSCSTCAQRDTKNTELFNMNTTRYQYPPLQQESFFTKHIRESNIWILFDQEDPTNSWYKSKVTHNIQKIPKPNGVILVTKNHIATMQQMLPDVGNMWYW